MIEPAANLLTIFTTCKHFKGDTANMQRNALHSWQVLQKKQAIPFNIFIIGNDEGSEEAAKEIGATHIPDVATSENGVPLLNDLFHQAKSFSNAPYLAYINSDIVLRNDFLQSISHFLTKHAIENPKFLLTSRRVNIPLNERLIGETPDWTAKLDDLTEKFGSWDLPNAVDVFIFNRDLFTNIPEFSIGRMQWDNWLLWRALTSDAILVDGSFDFSVLHPIHGYTNHAKGWQDITQGSDATINRKLANGNLKDLQSGTTHLLKDGELVLQTEESANEISTYTKPCPEKEFIAFVYQILENQKQSEIPVDSEETADIFRTLLYRNERYVPHSSQISTSENWRKAINKANTQLIQGNSALAFEVIEDLLAGKLLELLQKNQAKGRPIIIWGTGDLAKRVVKTLDRNEIGITGFADSDSAKKGKTFLSKQILGSNLQRYENTDGTKPFIVIASMYIQEIKQTLLKQGLIEQIDFTY